MAPIGRGTLARVQDRDAQLLLRRLQDQMAAQAEQIRALQTSSLSDDNGYTAAGKRLRQLADPADTQDAATRGYVDRLALQQGEDLLVRALTVSRFGTHLERLTTSPAPLGALFIESDRLAIYQARLVGGAAKWVWVGGGPLAGTLANLTTGLGANDAGFVYYATNFDRVYRWSGSAWADAPGQEPRGQIVYFPASLTDAAGNAMVPGAGWQLCDGTAGVSISTPIGGTSTITVPNLTGSNRFLRSVSGATGGTGGAATTHTHAIDPPNTTSTGPSPNATGASSTSSTGNNSAQQEVQAGTGQQVAAQPHTHNMDHTHDLGNHTHDVNIASFTSGAPSGASGDDALPPYYNARPYMRL